MIFYKTGFCESNVSLQVKNLEYLVLLRPILHVFRTPRVTSEKHSFFTILEKWGTNGTKQRVIFESSTFYTTKS